MKKKKSTMVTLILPAALVALVLVRFSLYRERDRATEEISAITDSKLDIANQKSGG
jgi:hypothetical protein